MLVLKLVSRCLSHFSFSGRRFLDSYHTSAGPYFRERLSCMLHACVFNFFSPPDNGLDLGVLFSNLNPVSNDLNLTDKH